MKEYKLVRIFLGEKERYKGKLLYKYLVEFLMKNKIAGATVLRGIMGYGSSLHIHEATFLTLSEDLPIIIEFIDKKSKIEAILPELKSLLNGKGLITIEKVEILYPEI